jgi:hypothetical protein
MMDGKWGANDVAEGIDYPRTATGLLKRNITFRLTIFTVVVWVMVCVRSPQTTLRDAATGRTGTC